MSKANFLTLKHKLFYDIRYLLAFGFGTGLSRYAPGTAGTLAAIPVYILIGEIPYFYYVCFVLAAFIVGVKISDEISKELNQDDYPGIVWDEMVGYWITMLGAPFCWQWIIAGFFLFRFFDILKPFPIRYFDKKFKNGFGVMFDDVLAGIMAWICLQFLTHMVRP